MPNIQGVTGEIAKVTTEGNLKATMPTEAIESGYVRLLGEVDAGRVTGVPYLLAPETSEDYRSRVELDTILDSHVFNEIAQFTGKHLVRNTTMAANWAGNALNTNSGSITTVNTGVTFQTYQYFPIFGAAQTYAYFNVAFTGTWAATNTTIDIGLYTNATTTPYAPTDGVYIRANNTGLFGVANFNGTEQTTTPFKFSATGAVFTPTIGTFYDIIVTIGQNITVFWMDLRDGNGYARMGSLVDSVGGGLPSSVASLPFTIRQAIGGTAASAASGAKVGTYTISQGGFQNTRSEQMTAAIMTGGQQGQQGHTQGSTAAYANNLAPTAGAIMSNTAALGAGTGGQFSALPTLAVNTDGIICSYQNPVPTASIAGKILTIKGIKIDAVVTTALAGNATPVIYAYSLAYAHTAVALTTTEGTTSKAPRRIYLGIQQFASAAPVGTIASTVTFNFDRPIPVNPGEFVAIAAKNIGAVTTTGVITFFITYDYGFIL